MRFGAYTASGVTSTSAKKNGEANTANSAKKSQEKLGKKPEEILQTGAQMNKNEKKIEFHRLAVVAFPMEHKCHSHRATKAISNTDATHSNNRIYQRNLGTKKCTRTIFKASYTFVFTIMCT